MNLPSTSEKPKKCVSKFIEMKGIMETVDQLSFLV